jgi:hypothetical protein
MAMISIRKYVVPAILLLLLLNSNAAFSVEMALATKYPGSIYFGGYKPIELSSLDDFVPDLREKVIAHLKNRLGASFFGKVNFAGGERIDIEVLHKVEPGSKNYRWEVPAYVLNFEFKLPEKGIASYTAQIELRSDGSVLKEIDLPRFSSNTSKLNFISSEQAAAVAIENGFSLPVKRAKIAYSKESDSLIWVFSQIESEEASTFILKKLEVSAHTGKVVRLYRQRGDY